VARDRGHEILEHTADLGLRVWAPDLPQLFAEGAHALIAIMVEGSAPADRREEVSIGAPDVTALFVDWLSEVVFLFDARAFVPEKIDVDVTADPWRLRGELLGADVDRFRQVGPAVKAVTYHRADVSRTPDGFQARVYLDV
jgi:SHS2 domain-containing protein